MNNHCRDSVRIECEKRLTRIETRQSEQSCALARIERKIDILQRWNGAQNVDIAALKARAAVYGALGAATICPFAVGLLLILFRKAAL